MYIYILTSIVAQDADLMRLIIPNTRTIDGIMRIFVRTGPGYDQCQMSLNIEVDLILCGMLLIGNFTDGDLTCGRLIVL
jgi:hypothetical protein